LGQQRGGGDQNVAVEFSAKAENGHECFVDAPEFFVGQVPDQIAEPACIDGTYLLDEDPGGVAFDLGLGSERRRPSIS
jgi:hypothetical protein